MNLINVTTSAAFFAWQPAAWLRVAGPDAAAYLQGQFTNELRGLRAGDGAVYGLWLSVKGKVLADSFVVRGAGEDEFWVGSYFSPAAAIRERLESYIIADDVTVEDATATRSAVTVFGGEPVSSLPQGMQAFAGRRGEAATEMVFPCDRAAAVRASLQAVRELTGDDMERRRIETGIPAVPADIGPGDLPQEGGLERDAISFTKGCYLGQEVMARLKSMGQVRRRLLRVRSERAEIPNLPAPLFLEARQVGELRSAVRTEGGVVGLAMLSLLHVKAGALLAAAPDGEARWALVDTP